jgi:hypothetical protein
MADKPWDKQQVVDFLKRTGEDLKRTGEEVRREAQRLIDEVRDPETQAKMKEKLSGFGTWAKQTAEDAATMLEGAVKKAEDMFAKASQRVRGQEGAAPEAAPPAPPPAAAAPRPKRPASKTVGKKAKAGGSRKPGIGTAKSRKTIGKKR